MYSRVWWHSSVGEEEWVGRCYSSCFRKRNSTLSLGYLKIQVKRRCIPWMESIMCRGHNMGTLCTVHTSCLATRMLEEWSGSTAWSTVSLLRSLDLCFRKITLEVAWRVCYSGPDWRPEGCIQLPSDKRSLNGYSWDGEQRYSEGKIDSFWLGPLKSKVDR